MNERSVSYEWNDERVTVGRVARRARPIPVFGRQDALAPRREVDRDDVAPAHHPRLGSEVDVKRDLAAVGRDVEVVGCRFPRRQREAGSGERVAAAARGDVADEHVRLAAVGEPMVPEAEFRALGDVRLDLGVLALLLALRLLGVGREIRPHPGDERDPLAVGKPLDRRAAGGERRQPPRFAAVGRDQVDLRLVVVLALRGERDRSARRATTSGRCPCRRR